MTVEILSIWEIFLGLKLRVFLIQIPILEIFLKLFLVDAAAARNSRLIQKGCFYPNKSKLSSANVLFSLHSHCCAFPFASAISDRQCHFASGVLFAWGTSAGTALVAQQFYLFTACKHSDVNLAYLGNCNHRITACLQEQLARSGKEMVPVPEQENAVISCAGSTKKLTADD